MTDMKKFLSRYVYAGILMIMVSLMVSCKEDINDLTNGGGMENTTEVQLSRINAFFELELPEKASWEVVYHPEWIGVTQTKGAADETLSFFAETNDDDQNRTDKITVRTDDGKETVFTITQLGKLNDDSNGIITDKKQLKRTYGVGYTIDAFGAPNGSSKYNLLASSPLNLGNLLAAMANAGEVDAFFLDENHYSRTESITGSSTSSLANQLSINAGMEVGITAFKLSIEGGFSKNTSSNESFAYAIEEIKHIVGSCYMNAGMLRYLAETGNTDIFQSKFKTYYNNMKANPHDVATMKKIVNDYGTHIVTQGVLGGELKLSMQMKITEGLKQTDINAGLELGSKVINASGNFEMSNKEKSIANNTSISLVTYGGNNVYSIAPGTTFEEFQTTVKDPQKLEDWVSSISPDGNIALIDLQTIPIYEIMPTQEAKDALREYIVGDYQKEIYSRQDENYKGPDLYKITGFNKLETYIAKEATVYIPEINMEIVAKRESIKEIDDKSSYITTVYSGEKDNVNYDSGFFLGNEYQKPCKFKRKADGTIEKEVFDLLECRELTELYVDATGNITIAPKGVADYYREISLIKDIDLNEITGDIRLESGDYIMYGSTKHNVTLAENANIAAISNVDIEGNFVCEDNNTIVIKEDVFFTCLGNMSCGNLFITGDGIFQTWEDATSNYKMIHLSCAECSFLSGLRGFSTLQIDKGNVNFFEYLDLNGAKSFHILKDVEHVYIEELIRGNCNDIWFEDPSKVAINSER
mgnify:CR=1 FL=1